MQTGLSICMFDGMRVPSLSCQCSELWPLRCDCCTTTYAPKYGWSDFILHMHFLLFGVYGLSLYSDSKISVWVQDYKWTGHAYISELLLLMQLATFFLGHIFKKKEHRVSALYLSFLVSRGAELRYKIHVLCMWVIGISGTQHVIHENCTPVYNFWSKAQACYYECWYIDCICMLYFVCIWEAFVLHI